MARTPKTPQTQARPLRAPHDQNVLDQGVASVPNLYQNQGTGFYDLPPELRDHVYELVLFSGTRPVSPEPINEVKSTTTTFSTKCCRIFNDTATTTGLLDTDIVITVFGPTVPAKCPLTQLLLSKQVFEEAKATSQRLARQRKLVAKLRCSILSRRQFVLRWISYPVAKPHIENLCLEAGGVLRVFSGLRGGIAKTLCGIGYAFQDLIEQLIGCGPSFTNPCVPEGTLTIGTLDIKVDARGSLTLLGAGIGSEQRDEYKATVCAYLWMSLSNSIDWTKATALDGKIQKIRILLEEEICVEFDLTNKSIYCDAQVRAMALRVSKQIFHF